MHIDFMKIIFFRADGKLLASSTLGVSVAEAENTFGRVFGRLDGDRESEEVLAVVGRPRVEARKIGVIIRGAVLLPLARRECQERDQTKTWIIRNLAYSLKRRLMLTSSGL